MLTCVYGKILLVIFDANKKSVDYLKCKKIILDHKKPKAVLLPPNFAKCSLMFDEALCISL